MKNMNSRYKPSYFETRLTKGFFNYHATREATLPPGQPRATRNKHRRRRQTDPTPPLRHTAQVRSLLHSEPPPNPPLP